LTCVYTEADNPLPVKAFILDDEARLSAFRDAKEAQAHFEGFDAESGAISLFAADGSPLDATFPRRDNRRFLGMRLYNDPGPFEVVRAAQERPGLLARLPEVRALEQNPYFSSLAEVRSALESAQHAV